jgi:hypothetical protein
MHKTKQGDRPPVIKTVSLKTDSTYEYKSDPCQSAGKSEEQTKRTKSSRKKKEISYISISYYILLSRTENLLHYGALLQNAN